MRMAETSRTSQELSEMNSQEEDTPQGSFASSEKMDVHKEVGLRDLNSNHESTDEQLVVFEEPTPLYIDDSITEDCMESQVTIRVHLIVIKLSPMFGVSIKGYENEFYSLLMKLEQNRLNEIQNVKGSSSNNSNNNMPKELKSLIFDMNFKDGESRKRGRNLTMVKK